MSFEAALFASLVRALVVALVVAACSGAVAARLRATSSVLERCLGITALLAVLAAPRFVVGYAWTPTLLGLEAMPRHGIAAALTAASLLPVGVGLTWLLPYPPLSRRAHHCLILARATGPKPALRDRIGFEIRGPVHLALLRFGVVFLMAFQEFDLVAVLGEPAWTVWLFDAQVGGLPLGTTLSHAALPATIEVLTLVGLLALARTRVERLSDPDGAAVPARWHAGWPTAAFLTVAAVPAARIASEAADAGPTGIDFAVAGEVGSTLSFAAFASGLAALLAFAPLGQRTLVFAAAPGLCGGLVVALVVQATFQLPVLRAFYDTPLPLTFALAIALLPLAIALRIVWHRTADARALQVAKLAGARRVLWDMRDRPRMIGVAMLFAIAAFEVVASAMLAPSGSPPASVRLYNLMHYGHSAGLSAMVAGTVVAVALVVASVFFTARSLAGRKIRT